MGLFGKKKEVVAENNVSCCCGETTEQSAESCCCETTEEKASECCCGSAENGICCIKVLGAGCKSCHEQLENVKAAVKNLGLDIEVEYVTDMEKIMSYGIMSMPAIVVNEKIASVGRVMKTADVEKMLKTMGA